MIFDANVNGVLISCQHVTIMVTRTIPFSEFTSSSRTFTSHTVRSVLLYRREAVAYPRPLQSCCDDRMLNAYVWNASFSRKNRKPLDSWLMRRMASDMTLQKDWLMVLCQIYMVSSALGIFWNRVVFHLPELVIY